MLCFVNAALQKVQYIPQIGGERRTGNYKMVMNQKDMHTYLAQLGKMSSMAAAVAH